jgi:hypothetical protein
VGKIALIREINLPTLSIELYRINGIKTKQKIMKAPHFLDWTDMRSQLSSTSCFWVIFFSNADAKKEPQRIATSEASGARRASEASRARRASEATGEA